MVQNYELFDMFAVPVSESLNNIKCLIFRLYADMYIENHNVKLPHEQLYRNTPRR